MLRYFGNTFIHIWINFKRPQKVIAELFTKVRQWAHKKGIYDSGDLKTQTLKLTEEAGELAKAVLHNDKDEVKDAIGDCMVVLINVAELACDEFDDPFMSAEECLKSAYNVIKDRTGKMKDGNFVKDN